MQRKPAAGIVLARLGRTALQPLAEAAHTAQVHRMAVITAEATACLAIAPDRHIAVAAATVRARRTAAAATAGAAQRPAIGPARLIAAVDRAVRVAASTVVVAAASTAVVAATVVAVTAKAT